ncbi:MAG: hypothetical protein AAGA09_07805 [Pseudomonadota bacterium]
MLPALGIVVYVSFLGRLHPLISMRFTEAEISAVSPSVLDTINGMAVFANGHVFALGLVALVAIWKGLVLRQKWIFWTLLIALNASMLIGFMATYVDRSHTYGPSIVSAMILVVGFGLAALDLFGSKKA